MKKISLTIEHVKPLATRNNKKKKCASKSVIL